MFYVCVNNAGACIIKLITAVIYDFRNKLECLSVNTRLGWKGLPIMLSVFMLSVFILSVFMLKAVTPQLCPTLFYLPWVVMLSRLGDN